MGFAIGAAAEGFRPVAEIQFADYIFPAFDQARKCPGAWFEGGDWGIRALKAGPPTIPGPRLQCQPVSHCERLPAQPCVRR